MTHQHLRLGCAMTDAHADSDHREDGSACCDVGSGDVVREIGIFLYADERSGADSTSTIRNLNG